MNAKQVAGIVLFAAGLGMLFASHYITVQVIEGKGKIENAQGTVDTTNKLFSTTPATKPIGQGLTKSAQSKINTGREQVAYYEQMASWLQIGGVICLVVGAGAFFFCRTKKQH